MEKLAIISRFEGALPYLSGFLFVLLVLCVLWLAIEAIGYLFCSHEKKKAAALATVQESAPSVPTVENPDQLPEEHLVAIAAAATMLLGSSRHRLVSIRNTPSDWGREGRRQHLHSHSFR